MRFSRDNLGPGRPEHAFICPSSLTYQSRRGSKSDVYRLSVANSARHSGGVMGARASLGFTLIELLVVIAIIGVLAGVGYPMVTGYIDDGKRKAAENGIKSIYLMQKDRFREEGSFYEGDGAATINTDLFAGNVTLDEGDDYSYKIVVDAASGTYDATATSKDGKTKVCINSKAKTGITNEDKSECK